MPEGIREATLIFNPRAGRANPARLDRARRILERDGIATELAPTDAPGAATKLARRAVNAQAQMVIVCGGDGTINEVVNGLAMSGVPLALLPAGTANVLAKELRLPWNIEKAAPLVARSKLRRIALGHVTTATENHRERYFISLGGAGPDGAIVLAVDHVLKKRAGILAYWAEAFRQLTTYSFPRFRVTVGSQTIEGTLVVVGRTKHYGGPFRITTEADLYGNDFELMICSTSSRLRYLGYVSLLWMGQLRHGRYAHFMRAKTVRCEPLNGMPAYLQLDGEVAGSLPAEFRIVPDALTLVVPDALAGAPV